MVFDQISICKIKIFRTLDLLAKSFELKKCDLTLQAVIDLSEPYKPLSQSFIILILYVVFFYFRSLLFEYLMLMDNLTVK